MLGKFLPFAGVEPHAVTSGAAIEKEVLVEEDGSPCQDAMA